MIDNLRWAKRQNREAVSKWGEDIQVDFPEVDIGDQVRLGGILPNPNQVPNPIPDDGYFATKYPINQEDSLVYYCRFISPETAQDWQIKAAETDDMEEFTTALAEILAQPVAILNITLEDNE